MLSSYDKIIDLWKAGKMWDAHEYFEKCKKGNLLSQEEIERLDKLIPDWVEIIIEEFLANPKGTYNLYKILRKVNGWDDETLCKELNISKKSLEDIQNFKLRSGAVIQKLLIRLIS
jgi:hypothetical protein